MSKILIRALFVASCVVLPVIWGYVVNRLFDLLRDRNGQDGNEEPLLPDYQI